jgi:hypothetical protein
MKVLGKVSALSLRQHLESQTDAEEWPAADHVENDVAQALLRERMQSGIALCPGRTRAALRMVAGSSLTTMVSGATFLSAFANERRLPMP